MEEAHEMLAAVELVVVYSLFRFYNFYESFCLIRYHSKLSSKEKKKRRRNLQSIRYDVIDNATKK